MSQLFEQVVAPPQFNAQALVQLVTVQLSVAVPVQSTLQLLPGQSTVTDFASCPWTAQLPPGHEKVQVAPSGQSNVQPAPDDPPQVWLQSPVQAQALPATHCSSSSEQAAIMVIRPAKTKAPANHFHVKFLSILWFLIRILLRPSGRGAWLPRPQRSCVCFQLSFSIQQHIPIGLVKKKYNNGDGSTQEKESLKPRCLSASIHVPRMLLVASLPFSLWIPREPAGMVGTMSTIKYMQATGSSLQAVGPEPNRCASRRDAHRAGRWPLAALLLILAMGATAQAAPRAFRLPPFPMKPSKRWGPFPGRIVFLEMSPNGRFMAAAWRSGKHGKKMNVQVADTRTGTVTMSLSLKPLVRALFFVGDRQVFGIVRRRTIVLRSIHGGAVVGRITTPSKIIDLAWNLTGTLIALFDTHNELAVYNASNAVLLGNKTISRPKGQVGVYLSGTVIALVTGRRMSIWKTKPVLARTKTLTIAPRRGMVRSAGESADGRTMILRTSAGRYTLRAVASGRILRSIQGPAVLTSTPWPVLSPSGLFVQGGATGGFVFAGPKSNLTAPWPTQGADPVLMRFDRTGTRLAYTDGRFVRTYCRGAGCRTLFRFPVRPALAHSSTTPTQKHRATRRTTRREPTARRSGARIHRQPRFFLHGRLATHVHRSAVYSVAFTPNGASLLSASADGTVVETQTVGLVPKQRIKLRRAKAEWLDVSPTGKLVAIADGRGMVQIRTLDLERIIRTWRAHPTAIYEIHFDRSGRFLLTSGKDGSVRVWDVQTDRNLDVVVPTPPAGFTRKSLFTRTGPQMAINSAAFSPTARFVAMGGMGGKPGTMTVWDRSTRKVVMQKASHSSEVIMTIVFTAKGNRLAAVLSDGDLCTWNTKTWSQVQCLKLGTSGMGLAAVPASSDVMVGLCDGTNAFASLVDTTTGRVRRVFHVPMSAVSIPGTSRRPHHVISAPIHFAIRRNRSMACAALKTGWILCWKLDW